MNRVHVSRVAACGTLLLSAAMVWAADDLPKAETVLDKYIEVTGGKAAYEKHHSMIMNGTMEVPAVGLKAKMVTYHVDPDKSYTEADIPGLGKMRDGSDGKVYWSLSSLTGPHIKEGAEKIQAMLGDQMASELHWRTLFKEVNTVGVETVDGKSCYKVELTPTEGKPIYQFYDKDSGLMVRMTMTLQSPLGEQTVDSHVSDYRKEADILLPHTLKQTAAGTDINLVFDSVKFDVEIPADKFELPDEIKALVNKK